MTPPFFKKILQRLLLVLHFLRILNRHLFQNIVSMIDFLHDPQHVADIHVNGAGDFGVEVPIFGDRLVGGIKIQTNQFTAFVHHSGARVTACGVGTGQVGDCECRQKRELIGWALLFCRSSRFVPLDPLRRIVVKNRLVAQNAEESSRPCLRRFHNSRKLRAAD